MKNLSPHKQIIKGSNNLLNLNANLFTSTFDFLLLPRLSSNFMLILTIKNLLSANIGIISMCMGIVSVLNKCSVDMVNTNIMPKLFIMSTNTNTNVTGIDIERMSWFPELYINKYPAIKNSTDLYNLCLITCIYDISLYILLAYIMMIDMFIIVE